jgi:hypothetical protein
LGAIQALPDESVSRSIDPVDLKDMLGEIKPDRGDLHLYGSPLEWLSDSHPMKRRLKAGAVHPTNGKLRGELFNSGMFRSLHQADAPIERWRLH